MKYFSLIILTLIGCATLYNLDEALVYRRMVSKSVLRIRNNIPPGATGSGFTIIVKDRQILVTNAHVCGSEPHALTAHSDETNDVYPIIPIAISHERDLCLSEIIDAEAIPPLPLADSNAEVGSTVYTLGFPMGRYLRLMIGQVERYYNTGVPSFATNIWVVPGQSGSPVLNINKEVVGVIYATEFPPTHTAYAVSLDSLKKLISTLR